jgi:DNA polymerase III epsilon subunit family exonuclease
MADYSAGAPLWARFVAGASQESTEHAAARRAAAGWVLPAGVDRLPPPAQAVEGCPLPYDWDKRGYAALDVETTGLDSARDRVIEIGVVLFSFDGEGALREEASWGSLIDPGIPIPAASTAVHGLTDLDIWGAPAFRTVADKLAALLAGRVFVAHNAPFDAGFIGAEYARLSRGSPIAEMADTLPLLRLSVPNLMSYSLGKAAFVLGFETGTSHRALDDAKTCMRIFTHSARILSGSCP